MSDPAPITAPAPLLLSASECSALCGMSRASWFNLQSCGAIPPACLRRGRLVKWSRATIEKWISLGCPSGERFEAMK
jgi:predicted DNA-binding transcriptional regulator AlpA